MKLWQKFLIIFSVGLFLAIVFAPKGYVHGPFEAFDSAAFGEDIDAYFIDQEKNISGLDAEVAKRVIWADQIGEKTEFSVLYLHGFSATSEEIRPVPDIVAEGLSANLVYHRFTGHGVGNGMPLAEASASAWVRDLAEAIAAAEFVGDRVIVISTSTGGTLAALAAADSRLSQKLAGLIFVSPNFRIATPAARILNWPYVKYWGPLVAGRERSFEPRNELHARYWTTTYPSVAVIPVAELISAVDQQDYSEINIPALFIFSPDDQVVSPEATRIFMQQWGGKKEAHLFPRSEHPGIEPNAHLITGDIMSSEMTAQISEIMLDWARQLE